MTAAKKNYSGLSVAAFSISLIPFISVIGGILGVIDLATNKKKSDKSLSIASIAICCVMCAVTVFIFGAKTFNDFKANKKLSPSEYKKVCESVDYDKVARNPDKYEGEYIYIKGEVIQVSESSSGKVTLRVRDAGSDDSWDADIWYVVYEYSGDDDRILEDDIITAYGKCTGVTTYEAVLGNNITIPSMEAGYIKIK